jgi:hypothetical protein
MSFSIPMYSLTNRAHSGAKTYNSGDSDSKCAGCARIRLCPAWWDLPSIDQVTVRFPTDLPYRFEAGQSQTPKEQAFIHEWL